MKKDVTLKQFIIITVITSIWIHVSEVFRYVVFVMPKVKSFFNTKLGVAEMSVATSLIWFLWDTLLTAVLVGCFYFVLKLFGTTRKSILISASLVWLAVFVMFWVATANMGLSEWSTLLIVLPLAWFEMLVGAWIAAILFKRK